MIVIRHEATGGRFRYPSHNINKETEEGFEVTQYVPPEFTLDDDQDPSGLLDFHMVFQENRAIKGEYIYDTSTLL